MKFFCFLIAAIFGFLGVASAAFSGLEHFHLGNHHHHHHHHIRDFMINLLTRNGAEGDYEGLLDYVTVNLIPSVLGFEPANVNGSYSQYKDFLMSDTSGDYVKVETSTQEIIEKSGFKYENHYATSDDGYVTQIIRLINPLADRTKLRPMPMILFHGGLIDPTVWVAPSAIKHHPEVWPRPEGTEITSSKRALAFALANEGFDVFLVGTRGCNEENRGRAPFTDPTKMYPSEAYWSYTMDSLSQLEVPRQIEKVLEITKAEMADVLGYSLSTLATMQAFAGNPEFAKKSVNTFVMLAPPMTIDGSSQFTNFLVRDLCVKVPLKVGIEILSNILTTKGSRKLISVVMANKRLRYTIGKLIVIAITGTSGQYLTHLEAAIYKKLFMGTGFNHMRQWCDMVVANRIQKFDYGPKENLRRYRSEQPPEYDLSQDLGYKNLYLVSGGNDNLAPIKGVNRLMDTLSHKPDVHNFISNYNHLDITAAVDNAKVVVEPLIEFLSEKNHN